MIEALERDYPEPSIQPADPALGFVAALLEDYADEWLNKAMFHYRWSYPENQDSAAKRLVDMLFEGAPAPDGVEDAVKTRMIGRLHHVGSSPDTAPVIEGSFTRVLALFERMLANRPYLFGARPSLADFGIAGQLSQLLSDPSPGAIIRAQAPKVAAWLKRMDNPSAEGEFASFDALKDDLAELLRDEVAAGYLVWMAANAQAVRNDASGVSAEIAGQTFTQKPQRYAAKALAELRHKRAALADNEALAALLGETGIDAFFGVQSSGEAEEPESDEDEGDDSED